MPRPPETRDQAGDRVQDDAQMRARDLSERFGTMPARDLVALAAEVLFPGRLALMTSFGAESAVLLDLVATVDRALPVLFADTQRLFPATLAYRDALVERLGLTDVRTVGPAPQDEAATDPVGALFALDPDRCCDLRKVRPMAGATAPFEAWITGRKRFQGTTRAELAVFDSEGDRIRVNPLATWSARDILAHLAARGLPRHPLVARGYRSIGCAPCTTPVADGEDERAGRWRGTGKTECGLHVRSPALPAP
jgi:phosphoadenosine phosphosulfate reductase